MRPIKADLDKALEQPWSNYTCILAQCLIRHGRPVASSSSWMQLMEYNNLMRRFDNAYATGEDNRPILWAELAKMREELPEREDEPICEYPINPIWENLDPSFESASLSCLPNPCKSVELLPSIPPMAPTPSNDAILVNEW